MNYEKIKLCAFVIILYTILSVILTFPLIENIQNAMPLGDPMLNTWILAWDVHSILTDPSNLFNANVFYPFTNNSLAFSEHLFANIFIALPIIVMTHNPILSYNIIFLLSFILSGFGMFLLVDHHINDKYSAFFAGVVFAFCTYRFAHLGHLQLLTAQWMPFSLLYLDRFLRKSTYKNLLLFYIFFVLQVLSSWYYTFYIIIALGLYFIYFYISNPSIKNKIFYDLDFKFKLVIFIIFFIIIILPFTLPYIQVQHEYGFTRSLGEIDMYSADVADYFLTPPNNVLYGKISQPYQEHRNWVEHSLFPGISVIFLSLFGLLSINKLRTYNFRKIHVVYEGISTQNFYVILAFFAFVLTLGPTLHFFGNVINLHMPYYYFFKYVPGFDSMRVPSRLNIIVMLSLSVLAGYGLNKLIKTKNKSKKILISSLFVIIVISESLYIPLGVAITPTGEEIPDVYKWLSNETGDFAIVELPTGYFTTTGNNLHYDTKYMYYSTYHWKKLVNGYSGFFPPKYIEILDELQTFPSNESINVLKSLEVEYIIIHSNEFAEDKWNDMKKEIANDYKDVILVETFGKDYVYQINLENAYNAPLNVSLIQVHMPNHIQKDELYTNSITITNDNEHDYISKPFEKIKIYMNFTSNLSDYIFDESTYLPLIIKSHSSLNIPFNMRSPKLTGKYNVVITISDITQNLTKSFEYLIIVVDDLPDSVSSSAVHAEYVNFEIPPIIPADEKFKVSVTALNDGDVVWRAKVPTAEPIGEVHIGNRWFQDGDTLWKSERGFLPYDVSPGQNVTVEMELTAPKSPGNYVLELDFVNEGITWFEFQGTKTIRQDIIVT